MDLRGYYRKMREVEASFEDEFVVLKSLATEAGGVKGRLTEAARGVAARMIVDGFAEAATAAEAKRFRSEAEKARKAELERRQASQVQFTLVSERDLQALAGRPGKE